MPRLLKYLQEIAASDLFVKDPYNQANSTGNKASPSIHQYRERSPNE